MESQHQQQSNGIDKSLKEAKLLSSNGESSQESPSVSTDTTTIQTLPFPVKTIDRFSDLGIEVDANHVQTLGQTLSGDVQFVFTSPSSETETERTFTAPKWKITAKSTFFASLFVHRPGNRYLVSPSAIDVTLFENIFNYIMTKRISIDEQNVKELINLSNKFEMNELKLLCEKFIIDKKNNAINGETVLELLLLAERCQASTLKQAIFDYVITNCPQIIDSPSFDTILRQRPQYALELYREVKQSQSPPPSPTPK